MLCAFASYHNIHMEKKIFAKPVFHLALAVRQSDELDLISWNNKMPELDLYFRFTNVSHDMHIYLLLKAFFLRF